MRQTLAFQVCADDTEQQAIDQKLYPKLLRLRKQSARALGVYFPHIGDHLKNSFAHSKSNMFNRLGETNVVDTETGQTLYDLEASQAQRDDATWFAQHAVMLDVNLGTTSGLPEYQTDGPFIIDIKQPQQQLPDEVDCLVVFGLGLGLSVASLVEHHRIQKLVIYEPDWDLVHCSLGVTDWQALIQKVVDGGGQLFLQFGPELNVAEDLQALSEQFGCTQFYLYQHLHHPQLDAWFDYLTGAQFDWQRVLKRQMNLPNYFAAEHEGPLFSPKPAALMQNHPPGTERIAELKTRLSESLDSLYQHYPDLKQSFAAFVPKHWFVLATEDGEFHAAHVKRHLTWYSSSPSADVEASFDHFQRHPAANQPSSDIKGGKLKHYFHYQYTIRFNELIQQQNDRGRLPDAMPALINFAGGLQQHLPELLRKHHVHSLHLVEPSLDLFYGSLACIDWTETFDRIKAHDDYLVLNLGDSGKNLVVDMLDKLNDNSGHMLMNTFFFIPRMTQALKPHLARLRIEMQNILALSEHYDHARFSFAHTVRNFEAGARVFDVLQQRQGIDHLGVPVMVVGNGPSLDNDLAFLRANRESYLLVSCGTALKALWNNGLQPDFHAEIEQNRCTYDIITDIGDTDYLKGINLLACTWVHPDTAALFGDTLTLFKSGEGATQFFQRLAAEKSLPFPEAEHAYPTASNFALSAVLTLGFRKVFLLGLDLGFHSLEQHHSKHSIYYNNSTGKELYNYKALTKQQLRVPGNFAVTVQTKNEFRLAAQSMETLMQAFPHVEIYNCSDGSLIRGAAPLRSELVLFEHSAEQLSSARKFVVNSLFSGDLAGFYAQAYRHLLNLNELQIKHDELLTMLDDEIHDGADLSRVIERQRTFLFDSYFEDAPIYFSLFVASVNYLHAMFNRAYYSAENEAQAQQQLSESLALGREYLSECMADWQTDPMRVDHTQAGWLKRLQRAKDEQQTGQ